MKNKGKINKVVIITGYRCNNNCLFCIDSEKRNLRNKDSDEIKMEMIRAKKQGSTYLELIGGETTIRPDILELIEFARNLGFETIAMATNGRMLSHKDFTQNLIKSGITSLIFSIHGHNASLHDSLTRAKGSFNQLKAGINNLKEIGFSNIHSNTTIVQQNFKKLPEIAKTIIDLGINDSEFIFADPTYGGVFVNFKEMMPRISKAAPYIYKALDIGNKNKANFTIRYVPLCYFKKYFSQISELREVKYFHTRHYAPDFINEDVEGSRKNISRMKPLKCLKCKEHARCEGIWREYLRNFGEEELRPIK